MVYTRDLKSRAARLAGSSPALGTTFMHFSALDNKFNEEFFKLVETASDICITSHMSPDPDSIASVLATYSLLSEKYPQKNIRIVYSSEPVKDYRNFKYFDKIEFVPDAADYLGACNLLIALDAAQYYRFTQFPEKIRQFKGKIICIDHHSSPPDRFDLSLIVPAVSSSAELIYLSILKNYPVSNYLAETVLLGILADTGNFSYLKTTQTNTLLTAKTLLEKSKLTLGEIQSSYMVIPKRVAPIFAEFARNIQYHDISGWPKFATSFVSREFIKEGNYADNEISKAKHLYTAIFLGKIEDCPWGFVTEPDSNGDCGISLRSVPNSVSVLDIAEKMGFGGGHIRASGGTFKMISDDLSSEDCIRLVLEWIKVNKPVIV